MKRFRFSILTTLIIGVFLLLQQSSSAQTYTMRDTTVTHCTGTLHDSGGLGLDYGNNEDDTFSITVPGTSTITLNFVSFNTELGQDSIVIYDGPSAASAVLAGPFSGTTIPGNVVSTGQSITIRFVSNGSTVSAGYQIDWDANLVPNVTATASANPICPGDPVTFTVIDSSNAGDPDFAWTINGAPAAGSSNLFQYTSSALVDDDTVRVIMTPQAGSCYSKATDTSQIIMVVNPAITPNVTATASANPICPGDPVTFTVIDSSNAGDPDFAWTINGAPAAGSSNLFQYTSSALVDDDTVRVIMTPQVGGCYSKATDTSQIIMVVNPAATPNVTITATDNSVCAGTSVTFTVTDSTNGGSDPTFQWQLNGGNVGTDLFQYTNGALSDNDIVRAIMTSNSAGCLTTSNDTSAITMNVNPNPSVSIMSSINLACNGIDTGSAVANATGGSGVIAYSWNTAPVQMTATATNLSPGSYQVTATDDSSCFDTTSVVITEPSAIVKDNIFITNVSSFGGSDGALGAHISGGTVAVDYGYSWNTTPVQTTDSISGLVSRMYVLTVTDDNNCTFIDSAFVDQPNLLTGGSIVVVGGGATKTVCDGDNVGQFRETAASTGGTGSNVYSWQFSSDLLNWSEIPNSDSSLTFTYNSTITQDIFMRRKVVDNVMDSAFSNVLFVDYIADIPLTILDLNSTYCENDPDVAMTGVPGGGIFVVTSYVSGNTFRPSAAVAGGATNFVTYRYTDGNGCLSSLTEPVVVNDTTALSFNLNSTYIPSSPQDTLIGTPPGGTFSGIGVILKSGGVYVFDPSIPTTGVPVDITYEFTNGNNCTSTLINQTTVQNNTVTLTGFQPDLIYCTYDPTHVVNVNLGTPAPLIVEDDFFVKNITLNTSFQKQTEIGGSPNSFIFDPSKYAVTKAPGDYEIGIRYRYGVRRLISLFPVLFDTLYTDVDYVVNIVNTGTVGTGINNVKLTSPINNSNGTASPPFQFCENLTSVPIVGGHPSLGTNVTHNTFSISTGAGLTHTNNNDTAFLDPSHPSLNPLNDIIYTFTDSVSGCFTADTVQLNIDILPTVSLTGIDEVNGYCANTGEVNITGALYAINQGSFTSATIPLSHINGNNTASFDANPTTVGTHKVFYEYTHLATGCANKDSATFTIDSLPNLSINIDTASVVFLGPDPTVCLTNNSLSINGLIDGLFAGGQGNFSGPGVTDNNNTNSFFDATVAGIQGSPGHLIEYFYTDGNGCTDTTRTHIVVNSMPNPDFVVPANKQFVCVVNDPVEMLPTNQLLPNETDQYILKAGGFSFPLTAGDSIYNPALQTGSLGAGNTDTIIRTVTNNLTGCASMDTGYIAINPSPVVSFSNIDSSYCFNEGLINYFFSPASHGNSPNNSIQGDYPIENILNVNYGAGGTNTVLKIGDDNAFIDSRSVVANQITVSYTHTDSITGCRATRDSIIAITSLPALTVGDSGIQVAGVYCYGLSGKVFGNISASPDDIVMDSISGFGTTLVTGPSDSAFYFSTNIPSILPNTTPSYDVRFNFHDGTTGCTNIVTHTVLVERPDTSYFTWDDDGFNISTFDTSICIMDNQEVIYDSIRPVLLNGGTRTFLLNGLSLGGASKFTPATNPVAIAGTNIGKYIYTSASGCQDSTILPLEIYPNPVMGWVTPSLCATDTVVFSDTSKIQSGLLVNRIWNFGESPINDTITTNSTKYHFLNSGVKLLSLTVVSDRGCKTKFDTILEFGEPPTADFTWLRSNECSNTVELINNSTTSTGGIGQVIFNWEFGDGDTSTAANVNHTYPATPLQEYVIELIANISNCADTVNKIFAMRPTISDFPYFEDFENGKNGWEVEYDYDNDVVDTGRWTLGTPAKTQINSARSGTNAWVTGLTADYANNDKTFVTSPCFDFTDLKRPMIHMWINYALDGNDGVVLQYSTDPDTASKTEWKKLGDTPKNGYNSGLEWYNKDGIAASPGEQSASDRNVGWTLNSGQWVEARHRLDEQLDNLAGEPYVRFRFAIGSGASQVDEGFAFDDIWIGERKKNVLLETFVNSSSPNSATANNIINDIVRTNKDVLNVQYHTSFPGTDPMNFDNQADPSVRVLYYGISESPYAVMDGNQYNQAPFDFNEQLINLQALKDPEFKLQLQTVKNGNELTINSTLNANKEALDLLLPYEPTDVTLHIVVIEDSIAIAQLPANSVQNGETSFLNTLKQMVPSAAGTNYNHGWGNGQLENVNFTVALNEFKGSDSDWKVIAFVQDNNTKEVYQAVFNDANNPTTGIENPDEKGDETVSFNVYPNPTSGTTYLVFKNALENAVNLRVINQLGAIVHNNQLRTGIQQHEFETSNLSEGMYYLVLTDETGSRTTRKLMVTK